MVHAPNFRIGGEFWGTSDLEDLFDLSDAINNRLTRIDTILGRHANPEIAKSLPRYLTWEGQLQAATEELDRLMDLFWVVAELSPAVLGLDRSGARVESGTALRLQFLNTEHKVNRRRLYLGPAVQQALYVASLLAATKLGAPYLALDAPPEIEWNDGLPLIYSEAVEDETRLFEAGLTSAESAIMRIQECSRELAQEELARLRAERAQEPQANMGLEDLLNGGVLNQPNAGA